MNFDKLFESKPIQMLQELGGKMQSNKVFSSISGGMMGTMNLILAGAVFSIISMLLNISGILETTDPVYQWLQLPYNMTMGVRWASWALPRRSASPIATPRTWR